MADVTEEIEDIEEVEVPEEEPVESPFEDAEPPTEEDKPEDDEAGVADAEETEEDAGPSDEDEAEAILQAMNEPPAKKKVAAPVEAKPADQDYDGDFDWSKTGWAEAATELQGIDDRIKALNVEIRKADEEGDMDAKSRLLGESGALGAMRTRTEAQLQKEYQKAEKQSRDFYAKQHVSRFEKALPVMMKKVEDMVPSMKKLPGLKNAVEMIFRRGQTDRFAGYQGKELERQLLVYAIQEGFVQKGARPAASAPKGGAPAKSGSAAPKAPAKAAGKKAAPASDGGQTWKGETVPSNYTPAEYAMTRLHFSEQEIKEKHKGRNLTHQ